MRTKTLRGLAAAIGILVVILAFTPSTQAAVPVHFELTFAGMFTYDCGTVTLTEPWTSSLRVTRFFDAEGNLMRALRHLTFRGVLTNPLTGMTADDGADTSQEIDLTTGTPGETVERGVLARITVPGYGLVWHDAGRVVYTVPFDPATIVFEAGPHEFVHYDISELCAAMS